MRVVFAVTAVLGLGIWSGPLHAQSSQAGGFKPLSDAAFIAQNCALCHGGPGHVPPNLPAIYGADKTAVYQTLLDFKNNRRPYTIMGRIARGFSDDQLKSVAEYLSQY